MYKKIGFVVADDCEFAPVIKHCEEVNGEIFERNSKQYCRFNHNNVEIVAVYCGVGKVNAAAYTSALIIEENPDCIINFGLSGAVSKVYKNQIVIGTEFHEHDFDLTPLGYGLGEKSRNHQVLKADEKLNDMLMKADSSIAPCVFVTGDCFVADTALRDRIIEKFGANCCDMETAAIASVCRDFSVPFASVRYLSDDADDNAKDSYREINNLEKDTLLKICLKSIQ